MEQQLSASTLTFTNSFNQQDNRVLTAEAVAFLSELAEKFSAKRRSLLQERLAKQQKIDSGVLPDFISETNSIKNDNWKIQNIPEDLQDRRVEITGPVERKMVINALNANVKVFMADFEDSLSPSWDKLIDGQINLSDAIRGDISYTNESGKVYQLKSDPAVLIARVRGLHFDEKHVLFEGKPIPGGLFDFALYFSITTPRYWQKVAVLIFIYLSLNLGRKLNGGAMYLVLRKTLWAYRVERLKQRF